MIRLIELLRDLAGELRALRRVVPAAEIADELLVAEQALERAAALAETEPD